MCISALCFGLNLDSIPQMERDSILKHIARTTVMLYGPSYYRDSKIVIERDTIDTRAHVICTLIDAALKRKSDGCYSVTFYYDQTKELYYEEFASKVYVWANDPVPFNVTFGDAYTVYKLSEKGGQQIRDLSTRLKLDADSSDVSRESMNFKHKPPLHHRPIDVSELPKILESRKSNIRSDEDYRARETIIELKKLRQNSSTFQNKTWKKQMLTEKKNILVKLKMQSDFIAIIFKRNLNFLKNSKSYRHISFHKNPRFFLKRIIVPEFAINEEDFLQLKNGAGIDSIMYLTPNRVSVYLASNKHVYYRIHLIKVRGKWNLEWLEFIPHSLSSNLIKSGLFKRNQEHVLINVLQKNDKIKTYIMMNAEKKRIFYDPFNFFNDYQTAFPNQTVE
jgi:hypothetical protein